MTAPPDDARALIEALRSFTLSEDSIGFVMPMDRALAAVNRALTEARIQGARDALKPAPHLDELTALSQEMGLYAAAPVAWQFRTKAGDHWTSWVLCDAEYAQWIRENPAGGRNEARALGVIATPSPAIAPLREAERAALDAGLAYINAPAGDDYSEGMAMQEAFERLAALSAAQGAAAEELTP